MRQSLAARPVGRVLVAGVLVLAVLASGNSASAGPRERKRQVDSSIQELQEALSGTSAELRAAYDALAATQAQVPGAQAALDAALAAEVAAEQHDADLAVRLEAARTMQVQARADLEESTAQIERARTDIGRMAGEVYRSGVVSPQLSIVLGAESPDDFATRYALADTVLKARIGTLGSLGEQRASQANAQARLDAVEVEVTDLREQAAAALQAAEQARAAAADRRAELDALLAAQQQATAQIQARKAEEEARLAAYEAEQAALEAELRRIAEEERRKAAEAARKARARGAAAPAAPSGSGALSRPVDGYITSGFGYRIHPIYGTRRLHAGTDFGAACGTPVRAAAAGTVVSAGWGGSYGIRVILTHGSGLVTTYNHMSGLAVRSGTVSRGQVIGYVGTTGASTGCHLHFETRVDGVPRDPMGYL